MQPVETGQQTENKTSARAVDRELALARLGGDMELLREIAVLCLSDDARMMQAIDDAAAARDFCALDRAAHALKGCVSNFGADRMYNAVEALERVAKTGDASGLDTALQGLREESIWFGSDLRALASGN